MKILRKNRKEVYNNPKVKYIPENKLFCKIIKSLVTDKILKDERITSVENNIVVSDENKLEEIFINFFGNIIPNLGTNGLKTLKKTISKYKNNSSIKVIRKNKDSTNNFLFLSWLTLNA